MPSWASTRLPESLRGSIAFAMPSITSASSIPWNYCDLYINRVITNTINKGVTAISQSPAMLLLTLVTTIQV